jgi:hypothetical protein
VLDERCFGGDRSVEVAFGGEQHRVAAACGSGNVSRTTVSTLPNRSASDTYASGVSTSVGLVDRSRKPSAAEHGRTTHRAPPSLDELRARLLGSPVDIVTVASLSARARTRAPQAGRKIIGLHHVLVLARRKSFLNFSW